MLTICTILLVLNALGIVVLALTGWRGSALLWAVQAEIVMFWLTVMGIAVLAFRYLEHVS